MEQPRKDQPVQPNGRHVVGLDIGCRRHAAAARTNQGRDFGRVLFCNNDLQGLKRLESEMLLPLGGPQNVLIGMEATGHYWLPFHAALTQRGYSVVVINPLQTGAQFRTRLRKTATDKLDARAIAEFVQQGKAYAARIPDAATHSLRLKVRQRWRYMGIISDLQRLAYAYLDRLFPEFHEQFNSPLNATGRALLRQLGLAPQTLLDHQDQVLEIAQHASRGRVGPEQVAALLERARHSLGLAPLADTLVAQLRSVLQLMESFESEVARLDTELQDWLDQAQSPLLSMGLSPAVTATIHAESDPITDFAHPWQYAAYAGLEPSVSESGNQRSSGLPISKRGSPYLRNALYLAALSLYRQNRRLQNLYQKSRHKGLHHTAALIVVAHKLARIIWRLLKDRRSFHQAPPTKKKGPQK
jgi:transposase